MLYIAIQCKGTPFRDKVWNHKANSSRLDAELWGLRAGKQSLGTAAPWGPHNLTKVTEGEECRM